MFVDRSELLDSANKAIEVAKNAVKFFTVGVPLVKRGPKGIAVDIPIMYMDFAIDRIHYDPQLKMVLPKGKPAETTGSLDLQEVKEEVEAILREIYVVEATEFREPEKAWIVPIAWNKIIIMHVKVSYDGEIIPDYKLTQEVRKHVN